ncbi:MAG: hypothetical protein Q7Q71_14490 [Verrucomicrobiota bacterium JB023]|nr:hypothetical protein [Verrucomicrobiota bacterium JB023]
MLAIYIAMEAEAAGLLTELNARPLADEPAIGNYYEASFQGSPLILATSGKDRATGVCCVGTEPAALVANELIAHHGVSTLLNAGTCGAHSSLEADIAEAFLVHPTLSYHDHRIPLPGFLDYGLGRHPAADLVPQLAAQLGVRTASLSTGNSLDHVDRDMDIFLSNGAHLKDMEGAALAWVCRQHQVPLMALKVVTDIFDLPHPAAEQFEKNLAAASLEVTRTTLRLLASLLPRLEDPE